MPCMHDGTISYLCIHAVMKAIYISGLNQDEFFDPIADGKIKPNYTVQKGDIKALTELLI